MRCKILLTLAVARIVVAEEGVATLTAASHPQETARLAADAGLGAFAEDGMATLHASLTAENDDWRLVVDPRLRLRTFDRAPAGPTVRTEDWDEPSDFAHALRELTYRHGSGKGKGQGEEGQLRLTLGEQSEFTLGHGSLVREYTNAIDPDHLRAGALLTVDDPWFGLEAMVDNLAGPRLVATRVTAHPLHESVTLGGSAAFDLYAPDAVRQTDDGARSVDGTRNLETYYSTLAMAGGDAEVLLRDGPLSVAPYFDANALVGLGAGLHAGALLQIEAKSRTRVDLRGEYRFSSDGYLPAYADTFYDLTRLQLRLAAPGDNPQTQRAAAEAGGFGGHGFLTDATLRIRRLRVGAGFSRRPGPEGNLLIARLDAPAARRVAVVVRYLHRGIGQIPSAGGLIVTTGLRVMLSQAFYLALDYAHLPRLDTDGLYRPIHIATAGLGATVGF